jgi:hypothetical protein
VRERAFERERESIRESIRKRESIHERERAQCTTINNRVNVDASTTTKCTQTNTTAANLPSAKPNAKATRQLASQTTYLQNCGGDKGRERSREKEDGWPSSSPYLLFIKSKRKKMKIGARCSLASYHTVLYVLYSISCWLVMWVDPA